MKVVTFGEIMLRLSPPGFERLLQSPMLQATFGGGEANVAVSLAQFGLESWYVTRVPKHGLGEAVILRYAPKAFGGRSCAGRSPRRLLHRMGHQRPSTVIYDRAVGDQRANPTGGLAARAAGADWFHVTGITPALGERGVACTREALVAARTAGVRVSIDLNFRKKLWTNHRPRR